MSENYIEIKKLNYYEILNNFEITFPKNKIITISGSNNCGKTTILRTIKENNNIIINDENLKNQKLSTYKKNIKLISYENLEFNKKTLAEEIKLYLIRNNKPIKNYNNILNKFNIYNLKTKEIKTLSKEEKLTLKIIETYIDNSPIILIDNIDRYVNKEYIINILNILIETDKTIIMTIDNLELSLNSDILYIIHDSKILLKGIPSEIILNDNLLNKVGLELPFMIDLSVKLKDYNLIKEETMDMDRMINTLWK